MRVYTSTPYVPPRVTGGGGHAWGGNVRQFMAGIGGKTTAATALPWAKALARAVLDTTFILWILRRLR